LTRYKTCTSPVGSVVPSQAALDACREQIGLETRLVVVDNPDGQRSVETSPPNQIIDAGKALELKNCTDSFTE